MSQHDRTGIDRNLFWAVILFTWALMAFWHKPAQADDDLFWYAYPMPQAYLYVQDPLRYALWSAHYGDRQARVPIGYPVYLPVVSTHDRGRLRRRECEIRILAGHRQ